VVDMATVDDTTGHRRRGSPSAAASAAPSTWVL